VLETVAAACVFCDIPIRFTIDTDVINSITAMTGWRADKIPIFDDNTAVKNIKMIMPKSCKHLIRTATCSLVKKVNTIMMIGRNAKNLGKFEWKIQ
jgi:hypothetical protein